MKKIIVVIIWLVILAGLIYYLISHAQDLKRLLHISLVNLVVFALSFFAMQFFNGLRIRLLLSKKGIGLRIPESFHLAIINSIANYLPVKSGPFATAFYLKRRYALSYTDFAKLFIASQIFLLITITLATIICIISYYPLTGIFLYRAFWLFVLLLISVLVAVFLLVLIARANLYTNSKWQKVLEGIDGLAIIFSDKRLSLGLLLLNGAVVLTVGIRFIVSYNIVSFTAAPLLSFVAGQTQAIATLLSLVPAGLGIAEFSTGIVSELMEAGFNIGIYAASVDRVISVLLLLPVSLISFIYIYHGRKGFRRE